MEKYSRTSLDLLAKMVDPKQVLLSIGGIFDSRMSENSHEIRCCCPLHGGDNNQAFSWKKNEGTWTCFTHGCGKGTLRNVFTFVSLKLGIPFYEAVQTVAQMVGFDLTKAVVDDQEYNIIKDALAQQQSLNRNKIVKNDTLEKLPGYNKNGYPEVKKYLKLRGYSEDVIAIFKLYPMYDTDRLTRMAIPVYDAAGDIVGVNARLMEGVVKYPKKIMSYGKEMDVPKYKMTSFNKGNVLYNLQIAKNNLINNSLILVEGQLDVIRLHTYGLKNAVCCMGTSITPNQAALIYKHCLHLVFLVEEGEAAEKGVVRSIKELTSAFKITVAKLPSGDADSNTKETIYETLKEARPLAFSQLDGIIECGELVW